MVTLIIAPSYFYTFMVILIIVPCPLTISSHLTYDLFLGTSIIYLSLNATTCISLITTSCHLAHMVNLNSSILHCT